MARPSQNIDKKLIEVGKKKLLERGISKLSVRAICIETKVNLGMFYYYFKTKENYVKILLQTLAGGLRGYWLKETEWSANAADKVKKVIFLNAKMIKEKRNIFETIVKDIDFSDEFYINVIKGIRKSWNEFFLSLMDECKKEGFLDKNISSDKLAAVVFGGANAFLQQGFIDGYNEQEIHNKTEEMVNLLFERFK